MGKDFHINASGEDSEVEFAGSYPPTYPNFKGDARSLIGIARNTNRVINGFMQWDTSTLAGTTILAAKVKLLISATSYHVNDADGRSLVAEYYAGSNWPIDSTDWTLTAVSDAHSGTTIASIKTNHGNHVDFALSNPEANISKTGYTGLRWHVTGGAPTGSNDVNVHAFDERLAETESPRLVVDFSGPPSRIRHARRMFGVLLASRREG